MKHTLAASLAALGCTLAHGQISGEDMAKQIAYSALHIADWQQTRRIAARPDKWVETNPILGPNPSQARINQYFTGTLIAHWGITYALPPDWRKPFQDGSIALEAMVVHKNYQLGISARF